MCMEYTESADSMAFERKGLMTAIIDLSFKNGQYIISTDKKEQLAHRGLLKSLICFKKTKE